MNQSHFTKPKLCKSADGKWYVQFRYNGKLKKFKKGLNYIKNLRERERQGNLLAKLLHEKLLDGWNPDDPVSTEIDGMLFVDAINFALESKKKNLAKKSYLDYRVIAKFMIKAIYQLKLSNIKITDVRRAHIRKIIDCVSIERKWSNKAYNKSLNYFSSILSELIHYDIIEYNPVTKIQRLVEEESIYHRPATAEEHAIIKTELRDNHPDYCRFIEFEYYSGARPFEILLIQLHMIDIKNRIITLPPVYTKTKVRYRNIIIDNGLLDILLSMEIHKFPPEFYLFGSFRQSGKGNRGKHLDFIPGTTPIKRDTAGRRWEKIVKKGLGIDVTQYSYKHKGGDDKLRAGVELDSIRHQFGHKSTKMTSIYVKEVKGEYKKDILDNPTEF